MTPPSTPDNMEYLSEAALNCGLCGHRVGSALHICGVRLNMAEDDSCLSICDDCIARIVRASPEAGDRGAPGEGS